MQLMCDQIVCSIRENLIQSSERVCPKVVQPIATSTQIPEDEGQYLSQNYDERNVFEDPTMPGQEEQSEESDDMVEWDKGLFLFNIAKKYGLDWAVPGGPTVTTVRAESARSGNIEVKDKVRLPEGTMYDLLKHLNIHLVVPHADEIVAETAQVFQDAPKRIKTVPFIGLKPIPMSSYGGYASEALTFLDKQFLMPSIPRLPPAVYPKSTSSNKNMIMTSIEAITALNILRDLPEQVDNEDYFKLLDHVTRLVISVMKKSAETLNYEIRETRSRQLTSVDSSIRNDLVNQPLFGDTLYTDYKKLLVLPAKQYGSRGQFRHPRSSRVGRTSRAPASSPARYSAPTPSTSGSGWGAPPAPVEWAPAPYRGRGPRRARRGRRGRR